MQSRCLSNSIAIERVLLRNVYRLRKNLRIIAIAIPNCSFNLSYTLQATIQEEAVTLAKSTKKAHETCTFVCKWFGLSIAINRAGMHFAARS